MPSLKQKLPKAGATYRDAGAAWADAGELLETLAEEGWHIRLMARAPNHWQVEIWRGDERRGQAGGTGPEAIRNLVDPMRREALPDAKP